jgi:hypothetical protein
MINKHSALLKTSFLITLMVLLSACSSTNIEQTSLYSVQLKNKPITNDHQLLLSLLNRPLPQDKIMMMQFAQQAAVRHDELPHAIVSAVAIRGDKNIDKNSIPPIIYSQLIYTDQNSIMVGAPR